MLKLIVDFAHYVDWSGNQHQNLTVPYKKMAVNSSSKLQETKDENQFWEECLWQKERKKMIRSKKIKKVLILLF
jgi:hypothetical protein